MTFRRQDLMKKYEGGMQDKIKKEQMCTLGWRIHWHDVKP
jgi:hypothetical protein